ncbi:hypothetical protein ACIP6X_22650 [Streptomyces coeruleorubidus]|uniref:hypothetical protein n=1 Tax=Streptomyces coeruleorubidus TaxID=116188 RepID=UPI00382E9D55
MVTVSDPLAELTHSPSTEGTESLSAGEFLVAKLDFRRQQTCSPEIPCNGAAPRVNYRIPQLALLRAVI